MRSISLLVMIGLLGLAIVLQNRPGDDLAGRVPEILPPTLVGLSLPSKKAAIAPEQSGTIVDLLVKQGDAVAKDQIVFRLSSRLQKLEAERLGALAKSDLAVRRLEFALAYAKRREERLRQLAARNIASDSDLEGRQFELQTAIIKHDQAVLDHGQLLNEWQQAKERLAQRTLQSPIKGIITEIFKQKGETADKLVPVLEVSGLDPLWVEFECPVKDHERYRRGVRVVVSPAARPNETRVGQIIYTSMKANPSSHTFLVRAAVANRERPWQAGLKMLVQLERSTDQKNRGSATPDGR